MPDTEDIRNAKGKEKPPPQIGKTETTNDRLTRNERLTLLVGFATFGVSIATGIIFWRSGVRCDLVRQTWGAGRVGRALGRRLRELGWSLGAITARTKGRARAAVRAMGGGRAHAGLTRLVLGSNVALVTTPDDAVGKVASDLARIGGSDWRGRVVLHASGALDRGALAPLERCGASTGSLHPMPTFTGRGVPELDGIAFAIEGDVRARRMARAIVRALGGAWPYGSRDERSQRIMLRARWLPDTV